MKKNDPHSGIFIGDKNHHHHSFCLRQVGVVDNSLSHLGGQPCWPCAKTGAAQRRRAWRLRSCWKHELQSVAVDVATALHHSALRGARPKHQDRRSPPHKARRASRTSSKASSPGSRPYVSAGVPHLAPAILARWFLVSSHVSLRRGEC